MAAASTIGALWVLWLVSWLIAARWASPAARRAATGGEAAARVLSVIGFALLLGGWGRRLRGAEGVGTGSPLADWLLVAATAGAFAFCWWARLHLGALWSVATTAKAGHRIVDTGPYGLVRHPIYTGIIAAAAAFALFAQTLETGLGALVITLAFSIKARVEERFLAQELGVQAYGEYARRTPMLIPFLRFG